MRNRILSFIVILGGAGVFGPSAMALTTLKQVQVSGGSQVDLLFDSKVKKDQIKTEFFNDIVQISLTEAAVYPAKISAVNSPNLSKIFAYQYAPKLVRCRLTVKGKAESFKDRIKVQPNGNLLTVKFDEGGSDQVTLRAAQAVAAPAASNDKKLDADEKEILEKVMKSNAPAEAPARKAPAANAQSSPILAGGKPLPSPLKIYGKLALVLGIFCVLAIAFKRFVKGGISSQSIAEALRQGGGQQGLLSRFAKSALSRKGKMIEVVANHYLGPKKSICVVKIAGRTLVLGITNEAINLITQISGDAESMPHAGQAGDAELDLGEIAGFGSGARAAGPAMFADLLHSENAKPSAAPVKAPAQTPSGAQQTVASAPAGASIRAQIKSRLEGLKPL